MKFKILLLMLMLALFAAPAFAQNSNFVAFDGFSFSFPSSVASNVSIAQYPGNPPTQAQPGGPQVKHTEFLLYTGSPAPQSLYDGAGGIQVYNTADFAGYDIAGQEYQKLQTLLAQHPDITPYMVGNPGDNSLNLPFLPVPNAAQVIRARVQYADTGTISGISYVTFYSQGITPFTGDSFLYTFQGLSADGTHYVAATFPLHTTLFPAQVPADFDYNSFGQQLPSYYAQSIQTLTSAQPTDFTPSLIDLDAVIQSFSFGGTSVPAQPVTAIPVTPTSGDATMGGLAGVTWTLVSYGDPADPTPVAPTAAPITIIFSTSGVSGNGGCNSYGGDFQYDQNSLAISGVVHTMMACLDQSLMDQENTFFSALSTASSYQINGNQLQISYDGGVLTFTAS